ncbi:MAG: exodeoxyribonuclease V subunit gamma [Eubacterium sp.]|nr:exodeoxyribonuclease V subunit gamma [Eubacterium sp.]
MNSDFKVIAGPSMSGKTYKLCTDILREANEHPSENYLIIIPEQAGNAYEKKLIELNRKLYGHPGFMNIDVIGFGRLSYRIFEQMGVRDTSVLEEYEKSMLIRVVSGQVKDRLKVFGSSIDKVGFTAKMKSLISELIQYGITVEDVEKVAKGLADNGSDALATKLEDVKIIYEGFNDILGNMNSGISEERMKLLARLLSEDRACPVIDNAVVCFDEFRGYTPDQLRIIGAVSKRAREVRFGLCIETDIIKKGLQVKEHDIFRQSYETFRSLQQVIGYKPEVIFTERRGGGMLGHLEKNVFRFPVREYEGNDNSLEIFSARDPEEEIRLVAESIRKEVRDGLRYKDIVVVTGDTQGFDRFADKIFDEYDIPVFCDFNRKLRKNPYTEAILRLFDIACKDYDYSGIFGFVKTGVLAVEDGHALDNLENHILRTGIRGRKLWEKTISPYGEVSEETKEKYDKMDEIRHLIVKAVSPMTAFSTGIHKVSDILAGLTTVIEDLDFENKMETSAQQLEDMGLMTDARVMRSLYAIIMKLIDETDGLLGAQEMRLQEFAEIFESGIEEVSIGVIPPTIDSVHICDLTRSRIIDAKVVHFINVNDGIVPASKTTGSILSDKDKDKVEKILEDLGTGKKLASAGVRQSIDELFMIYQILSKPTVKLSISYSLSDMEGTESEPSFLVGRIGRLFPDIDMSFREAAPFEGTVKSDKKYYISWLRSMLEEIHVVKSDEAPSEVFDSNMRNVIRYLQYGECTELCEKEDITPALDFSNRSEEIPDEIMRGLELKLSVSKLERYASCPYSYFLKYILGLKDRPEKKMEFYDVGNILHRSLELTMTEVRDNHRNDWVNISDETLIDLMDGSLEKAWDEYEALEKDDVQSDGKTEYVYKNMKMLSERTILTLKSHINSGEMLPQMMEQGFSAEFTANRPDGTEVPITIQGKIDRIDTLEEDDRLYVRVIDYKTGNHEFKPVDIKEGLDIQLSVYTKIIAEILQEKYSDKKVIPAGMYFYHVSNPVIKPVDKKTLDKCDGDYLRASVMQLEKELRLRGLSNCDPVVTPEDKMYSHRFLNLHDRRLVSPETGMMLSSSIVIPVGEKDGSITSTSVVAETADFNGVCEFSIDKMKESADRVLAGHFEKTPSKTAGAMEGSCRYCDYKSVCRFNKTSGEERVISKPDGTVSEQIKDLSSKASSDSKIRDSRFRR